MSESTPSTSNDNTLVACHSCRQEHTEAKFLSELHVCPSCGWHAPLTAQEWIDHLSDPDTFSEIGKGLFSTDPLKFKNPTPYRDRLREAEQRTGIHEAALSGEARLDGRPVVLISLAFDFLGGTMGSVVGEKLTRLIEPGTKKKLPVIIVSTSGGARMYEGMFSLLQMATTCGALAYHSEARLPYISVLTHPTTAGVMASYASVGDLVIAEPGAMIGFAGPRVIKDTTQAELPPGFQTAEFLLDRGMIAAIVTRNQMRESLINYLDYLSAGLAKPKAKRAPRKKVS